MQLKQLIPRITDALQQCVAKPVACLLWLGDKRRLFPSLFRKIVAYSIIPLVTGIAAFSGFNKDLEPSWWTAYFSGFFISYKAFYAFLFALISGCLMYVAARVVFPLLFYIPHAISIRSTGLLEARGKHNGGTKCLARLLKGHDHGQPIKVICISGRSLFTEAGSASQDAAPLRDYAVQGKLMVLMPVSDANNITIRERYRTYNQSFQESTYPRIDDLIREMNVSKEFLLKNARNQMFEHNELCMWRVVIMSHCCMVQNYFPNHHGADSDHSPLFIFEKTDTQCTFSYYDTFDAMFRLLGQSSESCSPPVEA